MSIGFGNGVTVVDSYWTSLKTTVQSKGLLVQYQDDSGVTTVFAFDGVSLAYRASMWDSGNPVPYGVVNAGYTQAQNDSDLSDFNTNFKPNANKRINRTDTFGNPIFQEFDEAVAQGLMSGVLVGRATGYVSAATLNTVSNVLAAAYLSQASAAQRSIKSSNVNDTSAGTGARTITINYLNNSMVLKQDVVTLSGTTAVNTNATDIQYVESMVVTTCGTDLANDGNIQLMTLTAGGGSVMAQINSLDNSTFYAHHYVPTGVTCYLRKHTGSASLAAGRSLLVRTGDPRVTGPIIQIGDIIVHSGGFTEDHEYDVPLVIVGPDRVIARENPVISSVGSVAYASFDYAQF